jgi:hypothetical protein
MQAGETSLTALLPGQLAAPPPQVNAHHSGISEASSKVLRLQTDRTSQPRVEDSGLGGPKELSTIA